MTICANDSAQDRPAHQSQEAGDAGKGGKRAGSDKGRSQTYGDRATDRPSG